MTTLTDKQEPGKRATISAFVVCCNEEKKIGRCLKSVSWCNEIVVVDSGSKDGTLQICRQYNSKILERHWPGFVEQKRFALEQCGSEWVLNIDADEEVSPELTGEIQEILESDYRQRLKTNGFMLPRVVFYLGRWWRKGGWYPEYRLRLCRRKDTTWGGEDPHEKALVNGPIRKLSGELRHYTYGCMADQISSLNKLSTAAAGTMDRKGVRSSIADILLRPPVRFLKFYLLKKGFLEGRAGFIVALVESGYVLMKYAKLWEIQHGQSTADEP